MNAARSLKEAAEVIARSPTALQLRYLQTLSFIAGERGSTIMFPIPLDMLGGMAQNWTVSVTSWAVLLHVNGGGHCLHE